MGIGYMFDKHVSVNNNGSIEQLVDKLDEEVTEFKESLVDYLLCDGDDPYLNSRFAEVIAEGCDVIHVVETILRYCGVTNDQLGVGQSFVHYKNQLRGYYDE